MDVSLSLITANRNSSPVAVFTNVGLVQSILLFELNHVVDCLAGELLKQERHRDLPAFLHLNQLFEDPDFSVSELLSSGDLNDPLLQLDERASPVGMRFDGVQQSSRGFTLDLARYSGDLLDIDACECGLLNSDLEHDPIVLLRPSILPAFGRTAGIFGVLIAGSVGKFIMELSSGFHWLARVITTRDPFGFLKFSNW
eukprot:CAMPEP_0168326476 /NCGR_PEP_ID=MMETSP0213-20121227/5316_1 /TAXON_ID=151035 /ORGANISM="Euplotes harpa, Strain FSP1.4" /LENGTH=197 /DNA_ID=CAMNT_0008329179 /DNA_START=47 /DNA_END=637 /DNA_ORIENTATION=+